MDINVSGSGYEIYHDPNFITWIHIGFVFIIIFFRGLSENFGRRLGQKGYIKYTIRQACLEIRITFYGKELSLMKTHASDPSIRGLRNLGKFLYMIKIMSSIKAFKLQYYIPDCLLPCIIL